MIHTVPTSGKNQGTFVAGSLWGGKSRLKAASLEVFAVTNRVW